MEFLETHTHTGNDMQAVWRNDSNVIEKLDNEFNDENDETENEEKEENEDKKEKKVANKMISDLEVCCSRTQLSIYRLGIFTGHRANVSANTRNPFLVFQSHLLNRHSNLIRKL